MEKRLEFIKTLTVAQFKEEAKVDTIKVGKSKNNKLMFQAGALAGACRSAGVPEKPMFSLVQGEDTEPFWLLHNEGEMLTTVLVEL